MSHRTRLTVALVAAGLTLAACGGDDGGDTTTATPTSVATVTTTGSGATAPNGSGASTTAAPATTGAATCNGLSAPAAGATAVSTTLIEWAVNSPTTVKAGAVAFTVKNDASSRHEFMLVKGTYATAPKLANGALDEAQLGADLLGQVDLSGNQTCTAGFDLAPGQYLIVCNINQGPNSHAARGQKLDFTVA